MRKINYWSTIRLILQREIPVLEALENAGDAWFATDEPAALPVEWIALQNETNRALNAAERKFVTTKTWPDTLSDTETCILHHRLGSAVVFVNAVENGAFFRAPKQRHRQWSRPLRAR